MTLPTYYQSQAGNIYEQNGAAENVQDEHRNLTHLICRTVANSDIAQSEVHSWGGNAGLNSYTRFDAFMDSWTLMRLVDCACNCVRACSGPRSNNDDDCCKIMLLAAAAVALIASFFVVAGKAAENGIKAKYANNLLSDVKQLQLTDDRLQPIREDLETYQKFETRSQMAKTAAITAIAVAVAFATVAVILSLQAHILKVPQSSTMRLSAALAGGFGTAGLIGHLVRFIKVNSKKDEHLRLLKNAYQEIQNLTPLLPYQILANHTQPQAYMNVGEKCYVRNDRAEREKDVYTVQPSAPPAYEDISPPTYEQATA